MKIGQVLKNSFIRNVSMVAGGTAAAQGIAVLFTPVITRLYSPDVFGVFSVFSAVVIVFSSAAGLSYSSAIVLPEKSGDAFTLLTASIRMSLVTGLVLTVLVLLAGPGLAGAVGFQYPWLYLLIIAPLVILLEAEKSLIQWLIREERFLLLSLVAAGGALIIGGTKTAGGLIRPAAGLLIFAFLAGTLIKVVVLVLLSPLRWNSMRSVFCRSTPSTQRSVLRRFRDFPLFRAPQMFLNSLSKNIPAVLMAFFFSPAVAGFYAIGFRVLSLPFAMVSDSVGKVFLPQLAERARRKEPISGMILRSTLALAVIGVIPFGFIVAWGPRVFAVVFGESWMVAGQYARWMALMMFFFFINRPAVLSLPVTSSQHLTLIWEVFTTCGKIVLIVLGGVVIGRDVTTVAFYSVFGAFMYIVLILVALQRSRGRGHRVL